MDDILQLVIEKLRDLEDPTVAEVFDNEILTRLADLEEEFEKFKMLLEAHLIVNGKKIKNLNKLDTLVAAKKEEMERSRREMPPVLLAEACPDAPDAGLPLYVPSGWWMDASGLGKLKEADLKLPAVCNAPLYPSLRLADYERAKTMIRYTAKVNKKWRFFYLEAGAGKTATVRAVKNAGVLVFDEKALLEYLDKSLICNWCAMPLEEKSSLFEEFKSYFVENARGFSEGKSGSWWKTGTAKDGTRYIAVTPEAFRKFARKAGAHPEQTLKAWQEEGILLSDSYGNFTKVLPLNGIRRRMIVFADFLSKQEATEENQAETEKAS